MQVLSLSHLSDGALDNGLTTSFAQADTATATVLAFIGEFDARQLYRQAGHPSMYSYLLHVRHLSESAAYKRMWAARVARRFPSAPLTDQPAATPIVQPASGTSDELAPGRVGMTTPGQRVTPLAPRRYGVQFTIDERTHEMLDRVRALMGRQQPVELLATVFARGLDTIMREQEKSKFAATSRPRPQRRGKSARHIPAEVQRRVWERDGGRCTFVSDQGEHCPERSGLEYDHIEPVGRGGTASVSGIRLRCRAHNQLDAERTYGTEFMRHKRESAKQARAERRKARPEERSASRAS